MTDQPSELRRLLDNAMERGCWSPDGAALLRAIVTRLDALAGAGEGEAAPHTFTKGQRVRILPCATGHAGRHIGETGVLVHEGDLAYNTVKLDNGQAPGVRVTIIGDLPCEIEPVAENPLASGNLATVTAERDAIGRERDSIALPKLLDELTPGWREETDDPLAAVRGIYAEKERAWKSAASVMAERDEARAKLAEVSKAMTAVEEDRASIADRLSTSLATMEKDRDEWRTSANYLNGQANALNALNAKLAEAVKERDEARKHNEAERNKSRQNYDEQTEKLIANLRHDLAECKRIICDGGVERDHLYAKLTASETARASAEAERDGERARVDEAAHRIRHGPYRDAGAWDARWLADYDSRRRPATEGAKADPLDSPRLYAETHAAAPYPFKVVVDPSIPNDTIVAVDASGKVVGGITGIAPTPAAGDFERRVSDEYAAMPMGTSRMHLIERALRAEDDVRRLREALEKLDKEPMMYWSEQKALVRAALSAEPRK